MLGLARIGLAVVLQIWANWDRVVLDQQAADLGKRRNTFGISAEQDVEDPFGLEDDGDTFSVAGAASLVARSLNDGEERFACEAEAPFGGVNGAGNMAGPWLLVEFSATVKELPEKLVIFFNREWVGIVLGEEDKGSIGTQAACLG